MALAILITLHAEPAVADEPPQRRGWRRLYCEPPQSCCRKGCLVRGFDGRWFIRDLRDRYRLNAGFYVQLRIDDNERTRLDVVRTRLILAGRLTRRFDYHIRLGRNADGAHGLALGQVTWHATPKLDVVVGEQFIAVTREDWMFVEDLLTTDYSATDTIFGTGVSSGVQLIHTGQRGRFYGAVSNGEDVRENGFAGNIAQGQWALTGRYERQLGTPDWSLWDDIIGRMGMRRGFLVGGGAGVIPGQGATLKDAFYGTLDVSYRCDRWSALVYGAARQGRGSNGRWWTNFAALAQVGWYATPILQLYGRYEAIDPGSQPGDFRTWHSLTLGCAYRPFRWTNRAHLALEFGRLFTPIEQTIVTPSRFIGFDAPTGEQEYLRLELMLGL